jgi:AcrR family transcriptional regulator
MNKREKQAAETIADIMRESEKLFVEQGFEKTTVKQIANKCGMTKGALYHHFKSKEAVLEKLLRSHHQRLLELVSPVIEDKEISSLEKIKRLIRLMREEGLKSSNFLAEYLTVRTNEKNLFLKEKLKSYDREFYLQALQPILAEAKNRGECKFDSSAEVTTLLIYRLDRGLTEEFQTVFATESISAARIHSLELLDTFVKILSTLLGVDESGIKEIIDYQNALNFFETILKIKEETL